MDYDRNHHRPEHLGHGGFGLVTRNANDDWTNAVDKNTGGTKKFVMGPWERGYELGTYGVDPRTHTAWAVINYNGDFAVSGFHHARSAHKDRDGHIGERDGRSADNNECREEHEEYRHDRPQHHEDRY
jgi:hypothetical protein